MRCTSNYPFTKPVWIWTFFYIRHKSEKVLIPRLLFILYDQYPYTFPPIIYAATKKTYDLSTRPARHKQNHLLLRFLFHFAHFLFCGNENITRGSKKPKRNVLVTIHVDPNTNISKLKILRYKKK